MLVDLNLVWNQPTWVEKLICFQSNYYILWYIYAKGLQILILRILHNAHHALNAILIFKVSKFWTEGIQIWQTKSNLLNIYIPNYRDLKISFKRISNHITEPFLTNYSILISWKLRWKAVRYIDRYNHFNFRNILIAFS